MASEENSFHQHLRDFVRGHEHGWSHHDWLGLLAELSDAGVDTGDPDAIGAALEQERVILFLEGMNLKGLGPKRRDALVARFPRLWDLRNASVEEIGEVPSFHRELADAVRVAMG